MFKQFIKIYFNFYDILQHNNQPTLFFKYYLTTHMIIRRHQCIGQQFHPRFVTQQRSIRTSSIR